ncbi:MAG: hypothetical protein LQ340_005124 [Diploschistes diacapsis]|nr:MAG: hypothetical protein LQ340_005124 [Diploschistes diacapsis]
MTISQLGHPPSADITAYTTIFLPKTASPANALKSLSSNAKKGSMRSSIASNLLAKRYVLVDFPLVPKLSKAASKKSLFNPYLDFWTWSCQALHWGGPLEATANVKTSHAVLPIFMHHFGCVVPSREALEIIRLVASDGTEGKAPLRTVLDIGSGNGYWTYMLRAVGLNVVPIDNQQSTFRCNWVKDTVLTDGVAFLKSRKGASEDVLLLVYPVVGGDFFNKMLEAYKGDRVVVAGTQCQNGYTGFADKTIDMWIEEEKPEWTLEVRIPLPSFAGKDEALFVFKKGPPTGGGTTSKGKKQH